MVTPFPSASLPEGFTYPAAFLATAHAQGERDLMPWLLDDADDLESDHRLGMGLAQNPPLVPFARLSVGDGESACFVASGKDGDPQIRIMALGAPGRFYTIANFAQWRSAAAEHAARWRAGTFFD